LVRGLAVLAVCAGVVLGGTASPARADSLTQLPSSIVEPSMVVDSVGQHVFISGGPTQSAIVVLDFSGAIVATITGEPGASQMAVDTATHTLYVALYGADAIGAIDTQTLAETSRFSVSPLVRPQSLVIAGGKVWFSNITGYNSGYVATMNLDGSNVTRQDLQPGLPPSLFQSVQLSAGGANNGLLATVQASGGVSLYDVSSGTATQVNGPYFGPNPPSGSCGNFSDFSVDPLGDYVLWAAYTCTAVAATSASGMGYYLPPQDANAVAWSPDGQYVALGVHGFLGPTSIEIFPRGSTQVEWGWAVGGVPPQGLAFSPDGTQLFAIVGYNGGLGFQVLDRYTAPDTLITSGPASGSTTYSTSASFSLSSHNAPATFQCDLDGAGWQTCSSPENVGGLLPGSHTLAVRSVVGSRIDPVGVTRTWTIQPPNTKITSGPSDPSYAQNATFTFTSDSPDYVNFICKLDAQAWHQCFSPMNFTNLAPGSHAFAVKTQDGDVASDVDPVGATQTWTILTGYELDVFTAGPGFGSVYSNPPGISCALSCAASFPGGTSVTLTAPPALGSAFAGWSGACSGTGNCVVLMSKAQSVTATFVQLPKQTLTVTKLGTGIVMSGPSGIACGSTCSHLFINGASVTLTATPAPGYAFTGWSGACTGTSRTCVLSMTSARATTARFAALKLLTVVKAGTGGGTVKSSPTGISCGASCAHKFAPRTVVTLTATAKAGSTFTGWSGACTGTGNCVVTMSAAKKAKATFARLAH
jgi:hypothetical protein